MSEQVLAPLIRHSKTEWQSSPAALEESAEPSPSTWPPSAPKSSSTTPPIHPKPNSLPPKSTAIVLVTAAEPSPSKPMSPIQPK
ncbi:hypothetical protein ACSBR1_002661 [Camellia fascicularis]